ncbi:MAG: class I SAM-dependent methyltransferase [Ornithinimicrobium sp.]
MSLDTDTVTIDEDKLMSFVFRAVGEVGAALNGALVVLGDELGYYRAMAETGPLTPAALAEQTGTGEPYAREWLNAQAAGEYVVYDPADGTYTLPPEHVVAFTDETSAAYLPGLFQIAHGTVRDTPAIVAAARSQSGYGWHEHNVDVHLGCERFFRPAYLNNLVSAWLPALDGVVDKLTRGCRVADIGCGYGASTVLMAQAFERSSFTGTDYHAESIDVARERAADAGLSNRVTFQVAGAAEHPAQGYDLVTTLDCLHDMGDPVGAARHVRDILAPGGSWMIVEPAAGDRVEDNLHPLGRAFYAFSMLLCTPASLSQPGAAALGSQAGPARIQQVAEAAGFTQFRTVASTPFNNVFEVRA